MKRIVFFCILSIITFFVFMACDFNTGQHEPVVRYEYTGLPVIFIETENARAITSRETWVNTNIRIVSSNPAHSLENTDFRHQIRGRGNTTWAMPKRPYRIRFREDTSLFGLHAARNWVLLANWKDATLLTGTIAFELGRRFNMQFVNNTVHVDVVLNGDFIGSYVLTEHMRVGPGRIDIDLASGWHVELDTHFDEEPKFRTPNNIPVMILHPSVNYNFVVESLNRFDALVFGQDFPNNNLWNYLDIDSFVDYIMINEIVRNTELSHPKSVFMYRENANAKMKMGHLWDFDWAFGLGGGRSVNLSTAEGRYLGGWIFSRFFLCPVFVQRYRERWNEMYNEIASIPAFIDTMYHQLRRSQELNNKRWSFSYPNGRPDNYRYEINRLKTWWRNRVAYLNREING